MRNVGSSIGIPIVIAVLVQFDRRSIARRFAEHITPFNDALQMPDIARTLDITTDAGRALLDNIVISRR